MALRTSDLKTVLDVARSVGDADTLAEFRAAVLEQAPRLVEGDVYGYNEVPPRRAAPVIMMSDEPTSQSWRDGLMRLADEHPLVIHYIATGDERTRAISDLVSAREYETSDFYVDVLSHAGGRDQLAVAIPGRDGLVIGLAVNRRRRGFSVRDHEIYDAVRPFLVQSYTTVVERERLRAVALASDAALDHVERPAILVRRTGVVERVTPGVARVLGRATPREGDRLAAGVAAWAREQRRAATTSPLALDDGVTAHFVRGAAEGLDAIVLEAPREELTAEGLRALGLTRREADVLLLVAHGLTNEATAHELGISAMTVAKHLSSVYSKLAVSNRTAAVQAVRSRSRPNGSPTTLR